MLNYRGYGELLAVEKLSVCAVAAHGERVADLETCGFRKQPFNAYLILCLGKHTLLNHSNIKSLRKRKKRQHILPPVQNGTACGGITSLCVAHYIKRAYGIDVLLGDTVGERGAEIMEKMLVVVAVGGQGNRGCVPLQPKKQTAAQSNEHHY